MRGCFRRNISCGDMAPVLQSSCVTQPVVSNAGPRYVQTGDWVSGFMRYQEI